MCNSDNRITEKFLLENKCFPVLIHKDYIQSNSLKFYKKINNVYLNITLDKEYEECSIQIDDSRHMNIGSIQIWYEYQYYNLLNFLNDSY